MKAAWAEAKGMMPSAAAHDAQQAGLAATLRRYGLDRLAGRARAFVRQLQAALRQGRQPRLPAYRGLALEIYAIANESA